MSPVSPSRSGGSQSGGSPPNRSPSRGQSPSRSRAGSTSGSASGEKPKNPFGPGLGFDPAKPEQAPKERRNTRVDLPPEAYMKSPIDGRFARRPGFNTRGKPAKVDINQFAVTSFRHMPKVYQYDITISPVPKLELALIKKLWHHDKVQNELKKKPGKWLYDGNKLAWSTALIERGEMRLHIDLDEGRPNNRGTNKFYFIMKKTTTIQMSALNAYLSGRVAWDNTVLECMNFLDHLIRQWPSENLISIKRNFYRESDRRFPLSGYNEVAMGAYASIRLCQSIATGGTGLGINVDVANTAMWAGGQSLLELVNAYLPMVDKSYRNLSPIGQAKALRPTQTSARGEIKPSSAFLNLKRFHKLKFTMIHQERKAGQQPGQGKQHTLFRFVYDSKFGTEGATAQTVTFEINGRRVTVADYFKEKYNTPLRFPGFPIIETTKKGCYVPIELCYIVPMQRFPFKLDGADTAKMIKIAVTRPPVRRNNIMDRFASLDYSRDPYLKDFGLKLDSNFTRTDACVLPPATIQFGSGKHSPGLTGRWDLRGKKFFVANKRALRAWGFLSFDRRITGPVAQAFARTFKQTYKNHGGNIISEPMFWDESQSPNCAEALKKAHDALVNKFKVAPDLIFCILRKDGEDLYVRLKKSADCRLAVLTQMLISDHVSKNNPQYHSNVCMKVNAKLGGATSRIYNSLPGPPFFKVPTMVIGVDVSHSSPGIDAPSMASMVMSLDDNACRYAAAVQTNGHRVEMLTRQNIDGFFKTLIPEVQKEVKQRPQHLYYFRDGVSEGQFAQVIEYEVQAMKELLGERGVHPKFTVIVATKRHHIRFFPADSQMRDKNNNPVPGTLVERDVTHPFHWDFYLCSHVAIQGTARPVHYHVILDEANCKPDELQRMIYEQCYMYARSTTSVSLHPAVYYAHLASSRARAHERIPTSSGPRTGPDAVKEAIKSMAQGDTPWNPPRGTDAAPLLGMGSGGDAHKDNKTYFPGTMWYI